MAENKTLNEFEKNEQLKYFIEHYWLFTPEWENSEIAKAVKKLDGLALCIDEPKTITIKSFGEGLAELDNKELVIILEWLKYQMFSMGLTKADGPIPYFINILGENIAALIQSRENKKKQG